MKKNMNKQTVIHKILKDELTSEEEKELLNSSSGRLQSQWDRAVDMPYADSFDGGRALAKITSAIWENSHLRMLRYYKIYSVAASVLLVCMLGSMAWLYQKATEQPDEMYVMVCGRQTVDSVTLPDGTRVLISSGSRLTYPKTFKGSQRKVQLSGQAFFDVVKDKEKPFIVQTDQMEVMALGTAFEVFSFDKASDGETVLLNGKVKVTMAEASVQKQAEYILYPNQKLSVAQDGEVRIEKVDADKYSGWRSKGCLSFENEKLTMIIPRLERWYKKKIVCDKRVADSYRFTFTIADESWDDVLRMLCKTSPLSYHEAEGVYTIKKK